MAASSRFFVDTNVLIAHMRHKTLTVLHEAKRAFGEPVVSEIVIFELEVGARRAGRVLDFQREFSSFRTYPITLDILLKAAEIQADLLAKNQIIGLVDTFIAATALHNDVPLFTLNTRHFSRVRGLKLLKLP
jgi:tRNA(fMet)-specific endonuclease VapC